MISVDLGDGVIRQMPPWELDGPHYSFINNAHEHTVITEYRLNGKLVHRSAHVSLKQGLGIESIFGRMG